MFFLSNNKKVEVQKSRLIIFVSFFTIFILLLVLLSLVGKTKNVYSTKIMSYTENNSYIEYPKIENLNDIKIQNKINKLLRDQILFGTKTFMGEYVVDFSYPNYVFEFSSGVGFANENIASFWYSFNSYGEVNLGDDGVMRDTYRFFCITINMKTGEEIDLSDFMVIDERLINSDDGTGIETNYSSESIPIFHNFKDAFMVYMNEDEKDNFHMFSSQYIIDSLVDINQETTLYIDKNKNVIFNFMNNRVSLPSDKISSLIYPEYLNMLE